MNVVSYSLLSIYFENGEKFLVLSSYVKRVYIGAKNGVYRGRKSAIQWGNFQQIKNSKVGISI